MGCGAGAARRSHGDFNFDYSFATQAGNAAFTEFLSDDTWKWVRPDPLIDTNWADHDGNGSDDYPDSMLDFVFVAGAARGWEATCSVVVRAGDFPDDQTTSDHRPVSCVIDVPGAKSGESIEGAIRKVLDDQVAAWNAADLDRFMQHYWKSDQLTFSSEGKTQRGWTATMQRYQDRYPTPEKMGKLRFSELEVQPLGPTAALVLGRWHLITGGEDLEGNFSLVFRQIDGRWQIMHDHTSMDT